MNKKYVQIPSQSGLKRAARLLKVLGHPARLQILYYLEDGEETVTAIQEFIGLTQAMTSQHMKVLYAAGLLNRRREGTSIYYRLSAGMGRQLLRRLRDCQELWEGPPVSGRKL